MKKLFFVAGLAALALGCRTHHLETPSGMVYKGKMFMTGASAAEIETPDGVKVKSYKANTEVEAMSAIAEAAARGAAKGALP